jgi:GR25 family glycosyltransferase involved in LPS biosynthesis
MDLNKLGKFYVINLERFKERRKHINEILGDENLTIINAIDNKDHRKPTKEWLKAHLNNPFSDPNGICTLAVVCCALSHKKAWDTFIESGDEFGVFFEDDIVYVGDKDIDYGSVLEQLKYHSVDVLFLGKMKKTIRGRMDVPDLSMGKMNRFVKDDLAAHAYVLSRNAAIWLSKHLLPLKYPLDLYIEMSPLKIWCIHKPQFLQAKCQNLINEILDTQNTYPNEVINKWTFEDGVPQELFYLNKDFKLKSWERASYALKRQQGAWRGYKLYFDF